MSKNKISTKHRNQQFWTRYFKEANILKKVEHRMPNFFEWAKNEPFSTLLKRLCYLKHGSLLDEDYLYKMITLFYKVNVNIKTKYRC